MLNLTASDVENMIQRGDDFDVVRIVDKRFDIDLYQKLCNEILRDRHFFTKGGQLTYQALGLQYADALNPFYDELETIKFIRSDNVIVTNTSRANNLELQERFSNLNELGELFSEVINCLPTLRCNITRLHLAHPGHQTPPHIDYDYRLHFPIFTNMHALMYYDDTPYFLKNDGHVYVVNTARSHHFYNLGKTARLHMIGIVNKLNYRE